MTLAHSGLDHQTNIMYTCDVCGYQTDKRFNYLRHQETHDEEGTSEEDASEESFSESDESEEELSEYIGDVWDSVMETSYENLKEEFDSLVDEYVTAGTDRDQAEILAKKKLLPKYRDEAVQEYYRGILWQTHMSRDPIHKKIKATAKRLREDEDYEPLEAWKYAIEKRKFLLDQKIKKFKPSEDSE